MAEQKRRDGLVHHEDWKREVEKIEDERRARHIAAAAAGDPGELNEPPLHLGVILVGGSVPPHYAGAYPSLGCCGGPTKLVAVGGSAMAHPTVINGIGVGEAIDGDSILRAIGGDVGFDDPVDIPAEAPLPPRTIAVEPPDGDDWIERYRETVSHRCQRTDDHTLAECLDWPCPHDIDEECQMVRERYAARHHSNVIPPCVHHDDVSGREGPVLE